MTDLCNISTACRVNGICTPWSGGYGNMCTLSRVDMAELCQLFTLDALDVAQRHHGKN